MSFWVLSFLFQRTVHFYTWKIVKSLNHNYDDPPPLASSKFNDSHLCEGSKSSDPPPICSDPPPNTYWPVPYLYRLLSSDWTSQPKNSFQPCLYQSRPQNETTDLVLSATSSKSSSFYHCWQVLLCWDYPASRNCTQRTSSHPLSLGSWIKLSSTRLPWSR